MASRRKLKPALELPAILQQATTEYLGDRTMNKLSVAQQATIMHILAGTAQEIAKNLEINDAPKPD